MVIFKFRCTEQLKKKAKLIMNVFCLISGGENNVALDLIVNHVHQQLQVVSTEY